MNIVEKIKKLSDMVKKSFVPCLFFFMISIICLDDQNHLVGNLEKAGTFFSFEQAHVHKKSKTNYKHF